MKAAELFDIKGKVVVITGATGALTGSVAGYLAAEGVRVACLGRNQGKLDVMIARLRQTIPDAGLLSVVADVCERDSLERARDAVLERWGRVDGLLNGAGGNQPGAVLPPDQPLEALDFAAFREVVDVNLHGTVLPTLVFAPAMQAAGMASVINYSSASVARAVTRVAGYSAAKAGMENFTRWLAVELGRRSSGRVRVNALVPGFFLGEQNRRLLTNEDGTLTGRGDAIVRQTPFGRFGEPGELHGAVHYLLSEASRFVTGTTLVVDGGFGAFSGV